jgi:zinc protease
VLDGLSGKIDQALDILMEVVQQPAFEEDDLAKEKVLQLARIKNLRENNSAYPVSVFMQTLFGEHAYARPSIGTDASVTAITKEDLQAWFKTNQRPLIPTIFIVGDTQGTGLVAPLADLLTNEDLHDRDIASLPVPNVKLETKETIEPVSRQQTALVYGFLGSTRSGNDRYALTVLENIVSGLGGRFFDAIREKQGLAYTVRTANAFFAKSGAIYTYVAFSPENEVMVKESLVKEIDRLRKEGVTTDEVKKAIAYSIGEHEIGLQTRTSMVLEYARAVYGGEGIQGVSNYAQFVRGVTADQVKKAAETYLNPQAATVAIVRGQKK